MKRFAVALILFLVFPFALQAKPFGERLKLPEDYRSRRVTKLLHLPAGATKTLMETEGPGCISHIWITANKRNNFRGLVLRMYWDGEDKKLSMYRFYLESPVLFIKQTNTKNRNWSVFAFSMTMPERKGIRIDEFKDLPESQEYVRCEDEGE